MKKVLVVCAVITFLTIGLFAQRPGFSVENTGIQPEISQERIDSLRQKIDQNDELKAKIIDRFDTDQSGDLSDSEISSVLSRRRSKKSNRKKQYGNKGNSGKNQGFKVSRERMVNKFDSDGDGTLSDSEKTVAKQAKIDKIQDKMGSDPAFKEKMLTKFDTDGSGDISDEEMNSQMLNRLKKKFPKTNRKDNLSTYDLDGDGILNETERAAMQADKEANFQNRIDSNPEMKQKILDKFDTDGDGTLSDTERDSMKEKRKGKRKGKKSGRRGRK